MNPFLSARRLQMQLWFDDILVAELDNPIPHQGTWIGPYRQIVQSGQGERAERICGLISLNEDWHLRLRQGELPSASEFDTFNEVVNSNLWRVLCHDGTELRMTSAPTFVEGEASWNHPESQPSRELAAHRVWLRLTGSEESCN